MDPVLLRLRAALTGLAGIAVALLGFYLFHATTTIAAIVLMLGVWVAGVYNRLPTAIAVSVVSAVVLDYFFIPPVGRITMDSPDDWVAFVAFLCASVLSTKLSASLKQQRDELAYRQSETEKLHALSRSMLMSGRVDEIPRLIVNRCIELFGFAEAALFEAGNNRLYRSQSSGSFLHEDEMKRAAINGALFEDPAKLVTIMPVSLGHKQLGSFGFRADPLSTSTLQALGNTIAIGLAQAEAREAANQAEAVRRGEELKSAMIDALAHDLKTPLTVIEASADVLLHSPQISSQQSEDLLQAIGESSKGLSSLLGEAIHLARIDAKKLKLERHAVPARAVIEAAVASLGERIGSHSLSVQLEDSLPDIFADRDLLTQVLKQLLDNAIKYSPSRSLITVSAAAELEAVTISVRDQGGGLTELEQSRVFDKFYRGRYDNSAVQGTGMGLAIAKEIMEAHGGSINVQSQLGRGTAFSIVLRAAVPAQADLKQG